MGKLIEAPSVETFQDHEGDSFSVEGDAGVELELTTVDTTADGVDGWQRFTLVFRGDDGLDGGVHRLSTDGLDPFDVALSPTPSMDPAAAADPESTAVEYEAVFTRHDSDGANSSDIQTDGGGLQLSVDSIMGGVELFAGNFAPRGFMKCEGQLLPISQYSALFSILGTAYGGDGRTTFALPDLRGRAPIGAGTGAGLSNRELGQRGGVETVTLTANQLAPHAHVANLDLPVSSETGDTTSPDGNALASLPRGTEPIYTTGSTDGSMAVDGETEQSGSGQPHDNMTPYLALTYVICVEGIYPSRN